MDKISRERVEGCKYCHAEWGTCDPITNRFAMPPGEIQFCPMCGKPLTEEAVDLIMRRLEASQNAYAGNADKRYKCRYADANGVCSKCSGNGAIIYCVEGPCPYMFEEVRDDGAHIEP